MNENASSLRTLLTLEEIAECLKVSRDTIYRMAQKSKIPAIKVGGQWRFDGEEISKWLGKKSNQKTRKVSESVAGEISRR